MVNFEENESKRVKLTWYEINEIYDYINITRKLKKNRNPSVGCEKPFTYVNHQNSNNHFRTITFNDMCSVRDYDFEFKMVRNGFASVTKTFKSNTSECNVMR